MGGAATTASTSSTTGETTDGSGGEPTTTESTTSMGGSSTTGMMGAGGTAGTSSGPTYVCDIEMTGTHVHPLTIPSEDVARGYQTTYMLGEASGHTHTLEISNYGFIYLQGGSAIMVESSNDDDHSHTVTITCSAE